MDFSKYIHSCPDFPKPHVTYWDFVPLLASPVAFREATDRIRQHFKNKGITHIAAIEAKGFLMGSVLAYAMHLPLTLIRKPGLTPVNKCKSAAFVKEYGTGEYEIRDERYPRGNRILLVYDILAGAGATQAAITLLASQGGEVMGCAYVIELAALGGRESLTNRDVFSLVTIKASPAGDSAHAF